MTSSFRVLLMATCLGLAACAGTSPVTPKVVSSSAAAPMPTTPAPVASPVLAMPMARTDDPSLAARLAAAEGQIQSLQGQISTLQQKLAIARTHMAQAAEAFGMLDGVTPVAMPSVPAGPTDLKKEEKMARPAPQKPGIKPKKPTKKTAAYLAVPAHMSAAKSDVAVTSVPVVAPAAPSSLDPASPSVSVTENTPPAGTEAGIPPALAEKNNAAVLTDIRVGDYPDKTRLVIEMTKAAPYTFDLDNAEKILVIDTDASAIKAPVQGAFSKSPLVAAYAAEMGQGGKTHLVIQLRTGVKIQKEQALSPAQGKNHRIMFDLIPAGPSN